MTPVFQTRFGPGRGNCLPACISTLLDWPLAAIPDFNETHGGQWAAGLQEWALAHGFGFFYAPDSNRDFIILNTCLIMLTDSGKRFGADELHAVVVRPRCVARVLREAGCEWEVVFELVHDPVPGGLYDPALDRPVSYIALFESVPCQTPVS